MTTDHHRGGPPGSSVHRFEGMPLGPVRPVHRGAGRGEPVARSGPGAGRRRRRWVLEGRGIRRCPAPAPGGRSARAAVRPRCPIVPDSAAIRRAAVPAGVVRSVRPSARWSPGPSGTSSPSSGHRPGGVGPPGSPKPPRRPPPPRSGRIHIRTIQPEVPAGRVSSPIGGSVRRACRGIRRAGAGGPAGGSDGGWVEGTGVQMADGTGDQMAVTEVIPPSTVRVGPGDERRLVGEQEADGAGDLVRGGQPLEGGPLLELLTKAGQLQGGSQHGCVHRARAHRVDPEPLGRRTAAAIDRMTAMTPPFEAQ